MLYQAIFETEIVTELQRAEAELKIIIKEEELNEFVCSDLRGVALLINQVIRRIQPQATT